MTFIAGCTDEHFFDFIELVFQSELIWSVIDQQTGHPIEPNMLVTNINRCFEVDDLPYYLTSLTIGSSGVDAYPQIIRRENDLVHKTAIEPALELLSHPSFSSANDEFLDALKDFRRGEYRGCVVNCGSALESVLKIICDRKGWPYSQKDTLAPLLKTVLARTSLETYFEPSIMVIATIRNRLSKAHGAGTQQKAVSKHLATYVINASASAILLFVSEANA